MPALAVDPDPRELEQLAENTPPPKTVAPPAPSLADIEKKVLQGQIGAFDETIANQGQEAKALQEKQAAQAPFQQDLQDTIKQSQAHLGQVPKTPAPLPVPERGQFIDKEVAKGLAAVAMITMGMAMFGARSRGTMAMAGLTGAMQGFHEGNEEKYKAGLEQYKEQIKQQQLQFEDQMQEHDAILRDDKLNLSQKMQALELAGLKSDNKLLQVAAQKKDMGLITKHGEEILKGIAAMKGAQARADQLQETVRHNRVQENEALAIAPLRRELMQSQIDEHNARATSLEGAGALTSGEGMGESALEGVDPGTQALVRKIASYDYPAPQGFFLRSKEGQRLAKLVSQYDPDFSVPEYDVRRKLRMDFTSGKYSLAAQKLNLAPAHLEHFKQVADGMNNTLSQTANWAKNKVKTEFGSGKIAAFNAAADAVSAEMATVFKGTTGTDQEIKAWRHSFDHNSSPEQFQEATDTMMGLMKERLDVMKSTYEKGMGKRANFHILDDKTRKIFKKFGVDTEDVDPKIGPQLGTPEFGRQQSGQSTASSKPPTAINPKTGERLIYKDGQWQKLQ